MKLIWANDSEPKPVPLGTLPSGTPFLFVCRFHFRADDTPEGVSLTSEGRPFIRLSGSDGVQCKVACLETGAWRAHSSDEPVIPLNAKVRIYGKAKGEDRT